MSFARRLQQRLAQTNIFLIAAGVAFYAMLAVFPGLTATISIWSTFADPEAIRSYLRVADNFIPPEAFAIVELQVEALLAGPRGSIGWGPAMSIVIALISARAGVDALVQGLNVIHASTPRTTVPGFLFGYLMTLALVGVMLLALATIVVVPVVANVLPFHAATGWVLSWFPWAAMLLLMLTALGVLYRYAPFRPLRRDALLSVGSIAATLLWGAASLGLTYYLANFGSYNKIYGSLGAVIALLMWLYLGAFSVLFGAALNAELASGQRSGAKA